MKKFRTIAIQNSLYSTVFNAMSPCLVLLSVLLAAAPLHSTPFHGKEKSSTRDDVNLEEKYRLPTNVVPESYTIKITPNYDTSLMDADKYEGIVVIDAKVTTRTQTIVLHKAEKMTISPKCVFLIDKSDQTEDTEVPTVDLCTDKDNLFDDSTSVLNERVDDPEIDWNEKAEKYEVPLENFVEEDKVIRIVLEYSRTFEDELTGFYKSTYKIGNENHALLTTKFEPTHARKAFPCFDEPALKATFKLFIELKDETNIGVISNMESKSVPSSPNIVGFGRTPKMSTYLLAFIVYEKDYFINIGDKMGPSESEMVYRTWGTSDMIDSAGDIKGGLLSQVEGPAAIDFLAEYTGIPYTIEYEAEEELKFGMTKMDMAAIPDFASGAMENWALVTYRESSLLYNLQTGTTANYKRVVDVIDHELTHMWFGNLVTLDWWNNVWLNEGFARYMQYLVAHDRYPNWHMLERFILDEQMGAFGVDADVSAVPISEETSSVVTPEEIGDRFSTLSYSKGGAILRQIRNVMGEECFKEGIRNYLKNKAFSSATPDILFEYLIEANNEDNSKLDGEKLLSVLKHWTKNGGHPVITVTRTSNTVFTITQDRFLLTKDELNTDKYPIYLTWITSKDDSPVTEPKLPQKWFEIEDDKIEVTIADLGYNDWVLFNAYQGGYYRVNYDDSTWTRISNVLFENEGANLERVAPVDRAALVDNALALARAGAITYERAFQVMRFLRHDTAFEPWAAARSALAHLQRMLGNEEPFKEFVAYIVEKAYNATGFNGRMDAHIEKVHRTNILTLACSAGYEPCLQDAKKLLQKFLHKDDEEVVGGDRAEEEEEEESVHPDLESVVFCYGLKGASPETWEKLWGEYAKSDAARRSTLVSALGCIDHREVLKEFMQKSLGEEVRTQDAYTVFSSVYSNTDGGAQVALDFLTFWGYKTLEDRYGAVRNAMKTLMSGLANRLMTKNQKNQFEIAIENKEDGTSKHPSYVRTVESNIQWLSDNNAKVLQMLDVSRTSTYSGAQKNALTSTIAMICAGLIFLLY